MQNPRYLPKSYLQNPGVRARVEFRLAATSYICLSLLLPFVETAMFLDHGALPYAVLRPLFLMSLTPLLLISVGRVSPPVGEPTLLRERSTNDVLFGLVLALPLSALASLQVLLSEQVSFAGAAIGIVRGGSTGTIALSALATWVGLLSLSAFLAARSWAWKQGREQHLRVVLWRAVGMLVVLLLLAFQQLSSSVGLQLPLVLLPIGVLVSIVLLANSVVGTRIGSGTQVILPAVVLGLGQLGPAAFAGEAAMAFSLWAGVMSGGVGLLVAGLIYSRRRAPTLLAFAIPVALTVPVQF